MVFPGPAQYAARGELVAAARVADAHTKHDVRTDHFSGNPNSQQQVYILAEQKIQSAAKQSPLLPEAEKNTQAMLTGMLTSLARLRGVAAPPGR